MKKAIVLLSGGLDSATTLAIAKQEGYGCYALTFNYGQRSQIEITAAKRITESIGVIEHRIFNIDISQFGGSALTDSNIAIPTESTTEIPATYVPARNTIFLSVALAWAEVIKASDIFVGAHIEDYSGYPDCRPEYFKAFQALANEGTKAGVTGVAFKVHTPLLYMNKAGIIRKGTTLNVDYSLSVSCYDADEAGRACGVCESCGYRAAGFQQAKICDPTMYREIE